MQLSFFADTFDTNVSEIKEEKITKEEITTDIKEETSIVEKEVEVTLNEEEEMKKKYPHLIKITTDTGYYYKCHYTDETFLGLIEEFITKNVLTSRKDIATFIKVNASKYGLINIEDIEKKAIKSLNKKYKEVS